MHKFRKLAIRLAVTLSLLFASTSPIYSQAVKGEKSVGPKLGYVSKNQSAMAGLFFQYTFSSHFRLSPEIGYTFRHNDKDAFTFDLNAHIPFGFTGERVTFYPLAGLNYSSWNTHFTREEYDKIDDVSTRKSRFGVNMGAGFELRCNESLKLNLEAKYTLIKQFSSFNMSAGISFIF